MLSGANAANATFTGALCFVFCAVLSACNSRGEESALPANGVRPRELQQAVELAAVEWPWRDGPLAWHDWDDALRQGALREERPLLFYVAAPGCEGLFVESSPLLQEMVEQRYVGVRIDPFSRPDLARYLGVGGCPALVVALPDGRVFSRAVDIPPRYTALFLQRSLDAFENARATIVEKVEGQKRGASYSVDLDRLYRELLDVSAKVDGGLYGLQKLTQVRSLRFIWHFAVLRDDPDAVNVVRRAVKVLLNSPLRDAEDGGFYLYSYTPDGLHPVAEKDALDQAELAHLFLDVGESVAVLEVLDYVRRELYDEKTGALRGRQVRLPEGAWWTDPVNYADRSASLVRVFARVAREQNDSEAGRVAVMAAAFLRDHCVDGRGAIRHECSARGARGLLVDQALVALALEDVADWSGDRDYSLLAHRVAAFAEEQLYSEDRDGFVDSADWPGMQRFSFADDGLPAGNALMIEWYGLRQDLVRARRLLAAARFRGTELGVATTWAQMAIKYEEDKAQ